MIHLLPPGLLILLLQSLQSVCQPLDLPDRLRRSCDFEDLRQEVIRQRSSIGYNLCNLTSLYDRTVKTNNYLQTQNSKLLERFRNAINDSRLFDLYMSALNNSVEDVLLSEIGPQKESLDLQVKTLEFEKDRLLKDFNDVRHFLTEASYYEGFFHVSDGRLFFMPFLKKNWTESEKFCRLLNGSLAKPLDEKMNTNMRKILRRINPKRDYWIGGIKQENEWFWIGYNNTIEPIRWFDWAPGEPNAPEAYCMQMWTGVDFQWDNDFCHTQKRFICAKPYYVK